MRTWIGLLLVACGVIFGLWAGVWWAFIGGIVDIINAFKATEVVPMDVAIGVAKIVFAAPIGWFSFFLISGAGYAISESGTRW